MPCVVFKIIVLASNHDYSTVCMCINVNGFTKYCWWLTINAGTLKAFKLLVASYLSEPSPIHMLMQLIFSDLPVTSLEGG